MPLTIFDIASGMKQVSFERRKLFFLEVIEQVFLFRSYRKILKKILKVCVFCFVFFKINSNQMKIEKKIFHHYQSGSRSLSNDVGVIPLRRKLLDIGFSPSSLNYVQVKMFLCVYSKISQEQFIFTCYAYVSSFMHESAKFHAFKCQIS